MRRLLFVLITVFSLITIKAQETVFVLVDVSLSIKPDELSDAKQALTEVLTGQQLSKAIFVAGTEKDLNFKLKPNDRLAISTFGSFRTTQNIFPYLTTIKNVNNDVEQILNTVTWMPRDKQTYYTLGKAKIAAFAKERRINSYRLVIISDNINDDYGKDGRPDYERDDYCQKLCTEYGTVSNPVSEAAYIKLKFDSKKEFCLSFSPKVDVDKYTPPPFQPTNNGITITTPIKSKIGNEYELNNGTVTVAWVCKNCPNGTIYQCYVEGYDGTNFSELKDTLSNTSTQFKLQNGKYRIIVSASGISADTTYIKVEIIRNTAISMTSPKKVKTKQQAVKIEKENVTVSWTCSDAPDDIRYSVTITGQDGQKFKDKRANLTQNSTIFNNVPDGKYKITVSATGASSDFTFIEINTGGGGAAFLIILLLIAAGIGGYFLWKKVIKPNAEQKIKPKENNQTDYNNNNNYSPNDYNNNSSSNNFSDF